MFIQVALISVTRRIGAEMKKKILIFFGVLLVVVGIIDFAGTYGNWIEIMEYYSGSDAEDIMMSLGKHSLVKDIIISVVGILVAVVSALSLRKGSR